MTLEAYPAPSMLDRERRVHLAFMQEAISMAQAALSSSETPVGCVIVYEDQIIGRGMNDTNRSFNGTRHAEFIALENVISQTITWDSNPLNTDMNIRKKEADSVAEAWCFEAGSFGKQEHKERYPPNILSQCTLYVTVEPCIMCASLLRQVGIRRVFFGAGNDKFGGTGGVLDVHKGNGSGKENDRKSNYEVSGGWLREEAILLLRRFYIQENERAPEPREKSNRILNMVVATLDLVG